MSLEESCLALMGDELDGPMYQARAFLADPEMDGSNPEFVPKGLELYEEQRGILLSMPSELAEYSDALIKPFADIAEAVKGGSGNWTFVAAPYGEAIDAVTTICVKAGTPVGDLNSSGTTAPSPTEQGEAAISGDYGKDLEVAGIVPDDVASYGKYMSEYMCDTPLGPGIGELDRIVRTLGMGTPENGSGPTALRITVAYFCPHREQALEKSLTANGL